MSDQSTPLRASVFSRVVAGLGALLSALSVLAIVMGALWFVVNLTISPLKNDVEELKGLKLGSRLASIETTLDNINRWFEHIDGRFEHIDRRLEQIDRRFEQIDGRLLAIEAKQDELIATTARLDGRVAGLESMVKGGLIVNKPLPGPAGKGNKDTPRPG